LVGCHCQGLLFHLHVHAAFAVNMQAPYQGGLNQRCPYSDSELLLWLERVNLPTLAERFGGLGAELDWSRVLSVGEQQRLAFARALLAKPRYLLLDESTSALDPANEERLYSYLAVLSITPISVSHHLSIAKHHRQILELHGDGSWSMKR